MAEKVKNTPIARLKWLRRPSERAKLPANFFLLPGSRKYPYRNKDGSLNCNLIRAAITRAGQFKETGVQTKAQRLYAQYCKVNQSEFVDEHEPTFSNVIELTEAKNEIWVNVLPLGEFVDVRYGRVKITKDMITQMVENFKNKIPTYEPPLTIVHKDELGAYGKVVDMEAREDGLWIKLSLTEEGVKLLSEKKFRYLSAEFVENYKEKESGKDVGATLVGVSLTNKPAHPGMKPIEFADEDKDVQYYSEAEEEQEEEKGDDEMDKNITELSEEIVSLKEENAELTKKLDEVNKENEELKAKLNEYELKAWAEDWKKKGVVPATVDKAVEMLKDNIELKKSFEEMFETLKAPELLKQLSSIEGNKIDASEKANKVVEAVWGKKE